MSRTDNHLPWKYGGKTWYNWYPHRKPPKWYRDHVWNNRVRVAVRDQCLVVRAEYRATGDVETVVNVEQHRHCASWLW